MINIFWLSIRNALLGDILLFRRQAAVGRDVRDIHQYAVLTNYPKIQLGDAFSRKLISLSPGLVNYVISDFTSRKN